MKKTLAKVMATAGALSLLASAIPFTGVSAEETDAFKYEVKENGVVITEWKDLTATEVTIPPTVTVGDNDLDVIGIADYAFGLCEDLAVVNVPDSLQLAEMGNTAFLTSSMVMNFFDSELSDAATTDDIIRYVAEKAGYKGTGANGAITDADIANLSVKLMNHLNKVDISAANTVQGKLMILIMNIDDMGFSQANIDKFNLYVTAIPYGDLTLKGNAGTEIETYAKGKFINFVSGNYVLGDANGDGKFDIRDAAWVARNLASGVEITVETNPAADFNQDGKVNVRDAAAMARDLATKKD
ncbi:dockerin type I repeat-containing protein [Porcipelethomonas sp.]|uniref:dockerin type I repeat-containing protein n=1 Tax=Porcipelethomonas sp. TaxID=2981675 RepID=UPI003EF24D5D